MPNRSFKSSPILWLPSLRWACSVASSGGPLSTGSRKQLSAPRRLTAGTLMNHVRRGRLKEIGTYFPSTLNTALRAAAPATAVTAAAQGQGFPSAE